MLVSVSERRKRALSQEGTVLKGEEQFVLFEVKIIERGSNGMGTRVWRDGGLPGGAGQAQKEGDPLPLVPGTIQTASDLGGGGAVLRPCHNLLAFLLSHQTQDLLTHSECSGKPWWTRDGKKHFRGTPRVSKATCKTLLPDGEPGRMSLLLYNRTLYVKEGGSDGEAGLFST
ncbi:hypothetical protein MG293_002511 [Ovis ammon polii]|uniref:Uncharacterized protein n=1 Tax=Ovis ammon polii TaxID=230172 RepID=A0AAD4UIL3_OVIAM|nr:hypothetical protein MG293_002511 [Ovis ammon polii]KAI4576209.1 hypothetical protein MJT46_002044 [Ovis ammon polii x Ovis aries]